MRFRRKIVIQIRSSRMHRLRRLKFCRNSYVIGGKFSPLHARRYHCGLYQVSEPANAWINIFRIDDFLVLVERHVLSLPLAIRVSLLRVIGYSQHGNPPVVGCVELRQVLKRIKFLLFVVGIRFQIIGIMFTSSSVSVSGKPRSPPSVSSPAFSISSMMGLIPVWGRSLIV